MSPVESQPRPTRLADRRSALLAVLREATRPMSVDEVASSAGIAASTAQFHLALLVSAGLAVRTPERSGSAGRPSWRYAVADPSRGDPRGRAVDRPDPYQALARVLAAQIGGDVDAAAAAREAGRRWGEALPATVHAGPDAPGDPIASLAAALDGLGFEPEPKGEEREIILHACPFEAVAREHRAVVCGVHLGLAEQTAAAIGGGLAVAGLEPFRSERPLACAIRLSLTS